MSKVFVLDANKQPLTPVHPGRARVLLTEGKAVVYRRFPLTLILKRQVEQSAPVPLRLKIDPGAKTTGLALLNDGTGSGESSYHHPDLGGSPDSTLRDESDHAGTGQIRYPGSATA